MDELDRRGRREQLETLSLLAREGPLTADDVAEALGGVPESLGRRLRRYRRRGLLGVSYGAEGPEYHLREAGAQRARWIRTNCCRTPGERTGVRA